MYKKKNRAVSVLLAIAILIGTMAGFINSPSSKVYAADPDKSGTYMSIDVTYRIIDSQEYALFTVDVNKARDSLDEYVLSPTFSGDDKDYSVAVYIIDASGNISTTPLTAGIDYEYDSDTGEVTFTNTNLAYHVVYTVGMDGSALAADMESGDGVSITAVFISTITSGGSTVAYEDTRTFEPLTAVDGNDNISNSTIITSADASKTDNTVIIDYNWSLYDLVDNDGNPIDLDVEAGKYFIFQVKSDQIYISNNSEGTVTDLEGNQVGYFYLVADGNGNGTVIIVYDNGTESLDNISGTVNITTNFTGKEGEEVKVDITVNGETKPIDPEPEEYSITKSGEFVSEDDIIWSILVNPEQVYLENLTITDNNTSLNWNFEGTSGITIYEADENGNKTGDPLVYGEDYTYTYSRGNWVISFGNTSKAYIIELIAYPNASTNYIYSNTAYSNAYGYDQLSSTATVSKTVASISKAVSSTVYSEDGSAATVSWTITYNSNRTSIPVDTASISDQIQIPYWYDSDGNVISYMATPSMENVVVTVGGVRLTVNTDYFISIADGVYEITFADTTNVTGGTGNITGTVVVTYSTRVNLSSKPNGVSGWAVGNNSYTSDGNSSNINQEYSGIIKESGYIDYQSQLIYWTLTVNNAGFKITDGTTIYDVFPQGVSTIGIDTIDNQQITVYNYLTGAAQTPIKVYEAGDPDIPSSGAYFIFDDSAKDATLSDGTVVKYEDGGGFALTYHGDSTNNRFVITTKTHYNYDPDHLGEEGYIEDLTIINEAILVIDNDIYYSDDDTTITDDLNDQGWKDGKYIPGTTDESTGDISDSQIEWSIYCNLLNKNLDGAVFEDVLQLGQEKDGTPISSSIQNIEMDDIMIYPISVSHTAGSGVTATITNITSGEQLTEYLKNNDCIKITQNSDGEYIVTIEFPNNYDDVLSSFGIIPTNDPTSVNRQFVVVITPTLTNPVSPVYHNNASLTYSNGDAREWEATVSVDAADKPVDKSGKVNSSNGTIDYTVVLNKNRDKLERITIEDSLMYDAEKQLLFLSNDETTGEYLLKIYYATVSVDSSGATIYSKGSEIDSSNYSIVYTVNDLDNQGFKVVFDEDFVIDVPIIMEYTCSPLEGYILPGTTITNSVTLNGVTEKSSDSSIIYTYTDASAIARGEIVNIVLKKVDESGNYLQGAYFELYSRSKRYVVRQGQVDENGELAFNDIVVGTYYLVETPPTGYSTDYADLANALQIRVAKDNITGYVTVQGYINGSWVLLSDNEGNFEIENKLITGSFKIEKYKNDLNGNHTSDPLANAEFVLYKVVDTVKYYYNGEDGNGIRQFDTTDISEAIRLVTNTAGIIELDKMLEDTYYLEETNAPAGFEVLKEPIEIQIPSQDTYEIKVYDDVSLIDISGEKHWSGDDGNYNGTRPDKITVKLYRTIEGAASEDYVTEQEVQAGADGRWVYLFENLPEYDESGNKYIYSVKEVEIPGYSTIYSQDSYDITNVYSSGSITILKTDLEGNTIVTEDAKFQLYICTNTDENHVHTDLPDEAGSCWEKVGDEMTINSFGYITWSNLASGEYLLQETQAPDGYKLPTGVWHITFNASTGEALFTAKPNSNSVPAVVKIEDTSNTNLAYGFYYQISNQPTYNLPLTGNFGIMLLISLGIVMFGFGSLVLINNRKNLIKYINNR